MQLYHLNPFLRYAATHQIYFESKENSICYDCRFFYVVKGEGLLRVNGQAYSVSPNLAVFLPPGSRYRFEFSVPDEVAIHVLNFDLTDDHCDHTRSVGTATETNFDPGKLLPSGITEEFTVPLVQEQSLPLRNFIAECVELFHKKTAYSQHSASAYLKLALFSLLEESKNEKSEYKLIQSVQEYIIGHYSDPTLNNCTVATAFHYHPYHVNRLMKQYAQTTLHNYIIDYRLHMAKTYLTASALNITEIARRTGFSSYTYFIKLFRERVGTSPLQYRKTHASIGF